MSQDLLESRWSETKDALLEGLGGSKRNSMSVILVGAHFRFPAPSPTGRHWTSGSPMDRPARRPRCN